MNHLPDLLPHIRSITSGYVVTISFVAAVLFTVYKVRNMVILLMGASDSSSYSLVPTSHAFEGFQRSLVLYLLLATSHIWETTMRLCARNGGANMVPLYSRSALETRALSLSTHSKTARRFSYQTPRASSTDPSCTLSMASSRRLKVSPSAVRPGMKAAETSGKPHPRLSARA